VSGKRAATSNRQLAEEMYALFNARDVDALLERAAPDVEWDWSRSRGPDAGMLHGRGNVRHFLCENWEHWETIEMIPEEIVDAGDHVVVFVHVRLRGRDGLELDVHGPHVQTWRDGVLIRYRLFQDRAEALAAVGL
jgi:ketosteroid isomerase-like protein